MAVDPAGNLFITDILRQRIRMIDLNGIITTVAGGSNGYSGDGGPAINAALNYPYSIAADDGNIYVSDGLNQAVRVLRPLK
jgi:hypothetical protein